MTWRTRFFSHLLKAQVCWAFPKSKRPPGSHVPVASSGCLSEVATAYGAYRDSLSLVSIFAKRPAPVPVMAFIATNAALRKIMQKGFVLLLIGTTAKGICMATADDLMTSAQRFYALARVASNATTKLQLVSLADDYFRQANEIRRISSSRFAQARISQSQLVDELPSNDSRSSLVAR